MMQDFRNYLDKNNKFQYLIEHTYRQCIQNQTLEYVLDIKALYIKQPNIKKTIW